jgi:multiple sugar transport system permease protein
MKVLTIHNKTLRNNLEAYTFTGPAALVLLFVMALPIIMVLYYSFFDNMVVDNTPFSGLKNYIRFLKDPDLMKMVRFTVVFTVGSVFLHLVIGLFLATKLNADINPFLLGILRAIFILPWIFTAAVVAIAWQLVLLPQGILNSVLSSLVGERLLFDYLGRPLIAMTTLIVVNAWRGYPFCMTSFLAGLQSIPGALYEAASIDGANKTQQFFLITIPQLKPVILSVVLLDSIWTLNLFPLIWLLTGGGPLGSTDTIATFTYRYAFVDYQFGMASAAATVGLIVTMIFTVFYVKRQKID